MARTPTNPFKGKSVVPTCVSVPLRGRARGDAALAVVDARQAVALPSHAELGEHTPFGSLANTPGKATSLEERLAPSGGSPFIPSNHRSNATGELEHRNWYRYWLLNDDRDQARADLKAIFRAEELLREHWSAPPVSG